MSCASIAVLTGQPSFRRSRPQPRGTARQATRRPAVAAALGRRESELPDTPSLHSALIGLVGSMALAVGPAVAIGPESVPLEVVSYEVIPCPVGVGKGPKCLEVTAEAEGKSGKSAFNSEVFGKVRFSGSGESALYGDFAEASDAGKMSDIPEEIKKGKNTVKFMLKLAETYTPEQSLDFIGVKARTYPGMRQDFRIMKPVTATEDCPEAELGEPCEEIPF